MSKNTTNIEDDAYNPADIHGVHRYRFKWKTLISGPPKNIKQIIMKFEKETPVFYFEIIDDTSKTTKLKEIINVKILSKIESMSSNFNVIGARGRNVIIGNINLTEFGIPNEKLLVLSSLMDWRYYSKR